MQFGATAAGTSESSLMQPVATAAGISDSSLMQPVANAASPSDPSLVQSRATAAGTSAGCPRMGCACGRPPDYIVRSGAAIAPGANSSATSTASNP